MSTNPTIKPAAQPSTSTLDPRGPRFAAGVTAMVLSLVLILAPGPVVIALLGWQATVFAIGVIRGPGAGPYGIVFRAMIRPRLRPPTEVEDAAPPRFAQGVGLAFALTALLGFLADLDTLGVIATAFALFAAILNSVFGICLGCMVYVAGLRLARARRA